MRDALVAAVDVVNGAMIALVPSDADAKRLAIEGGEPLDQLHLTLLYLGEADQIDPETRAALIDAGETLVLGWDGVVAEAFAPALFNPTGDEPCAVMLCSGDELAEFYETVIADATELINLPDDMKRPWCAHITLAYLTPGEDPGLIDMGIDGLDVATRCGPVTFDLLRFAFGGEITDIPLIAPAQPSNSLRDVAATTAETLAADDSPVVAPDPAVVAATSRSEFDGCLRCYRSAHAGDCPLAF